MQALFKFQGQKRKYLEIEISNESWYNSLTKKKY